MLAVRRDGHDDVRVFSEGLAADEAERLAARCLHGDEHDGRALSVPVASSLRNYGHLIAVHPAGMRFFPQEKQLLGLYAKHAAAVLDTALAFEAASRRHLDVSALLSLSQALAQAGTTEEIAARLCEAVTGVVDCDRASVWIWDNQADHLRGEGERDDDHAAATGPIVRGATPYLDRMLSDPQPMFFGAESTTRCSRR